MTPFIYLAIFITLLLAIATIFVRKQIIQNSTAERIKNRKRLLVWWVIFALCLLVFQLGAIAVCVSICGLLYWINLEIFNLFGKQLKTHHILILACIVLVLSVMTLNYPKHSLFIFALAFLATALVYFVSINSSLYIPIFSLYCAFSLFSIVLIIRLAHEASLDYPYLLLVLKAGEYV